ncbi:MAG: hypothetical protein J5J06_00210 [Phycisphaerae bacterium]|nr:hypothetical protein [Phycisphaerae bacterium]
MRSGLNTPVAELDLTARGRAVIAELEVGDSDELARPPFNEITRAWGYHSWDARVEIQRVLEGLGYRTHID